MHVVVLYFASLRERAGTGRDELELPGGVTIHEVISHVRALHPSLGELGAGVRFARNEVLATLEDIVRDRDELALLPPVCGG